MTKGKAIDDLEIRLGQTTSDRTIPRKLIAEWVSCIADDLSADEEIDSRRLRPFNCVSVSKIPSDCSNCPPETVIELPVTVADYDEDMGVYCVATAKGRIINRGGSMKESLIQSDLMFSNEEEWFRRGNDIVLKGKFAANSKFNLTLAVSISEIGEDEELPLSAGKCEELKESVEAIGIRKLRGIVDDLGNDGVDSKII